MEKRTFTRIELEKLENLRAHLWLAVIFKKVERAGRLRASIRRIIEGHESG